MIVNMTELVYLSERLLDTSQVVSLLSREARSEFSFSSFGSEMYIKYNLWLNGKKQSLQWTWYFNDLMKSYKDDKYLLGEAELYAFENKGAKTSILISFQWASLRILCNFLQTTILSHYGGWVNSLSATGNWYTVDNIYDIEAEYDKEQYGLTFLNLDQLVE